MNSLVFFGLERPIKRQRGGTLWTKILNIVLQFQIKSNSIPLGGVERGAIGLTLSSCVERAAKGWTSPSGMLSFCMLLIAVSNCICKCCTWVLFKDDSNLPFERTKRANSSRAERRLTSTSKEVVVVSSGSSPPHPHFLLQQYVEMPTHFHHCSPNPHRFHLHRQVFHHPQ